MEFDFGTGLNRRGTQCEKWDGVPEGVLPLFVADMDFPCAPCVVSAVTGRAMHPAYGYTFLSARDKRAVISYYEKRHGWKIDEAHLFFTPGVVKSMMIMAQALTKPGDKILVQPPVYGPFYRAAGADGRQIVRNPLKKTPGGYEMDFDDLEKKLEGCKLMFLCSPHNPVGKVWEKEVLERVLALCKQKGVYLMADEIHCDFVYEGHRHVPVLTLKGAEKGVVSAVSATKSFNIAGLDHSTMVIPDEEIAGRAREQMALMGYNGINLFGVAATTAAYEEGGPWLDALLELLQKNRDLAVQRLNGMGFLTDACEGSYLLWVDMSGLAPSSKEIYETLLEKAKVRLNPGTDFGIEGEGFMRLNLACPTERLQEALSRIEAIAGSK